MSQKGIPLDNTILGHFLEKVFLNNSTKPQNCYHRNFTVKYYEFATFFEVQIIGGFDARQKKPGTVEWFTILNNLIVCVYYIFLCLILAPCVLRVIIWGIDN